MAIQYRKSKKIAPGVRATVSSSGASMSFGGNGYRKTVSKRGVTTTVGIPGTGIYSRTTKSWDTIDKERLQNSIQRHKSAEMQSLAFKESPFLMILSCCCVAFGFFSLFIPEISAWWFIPGVISGIIFALWGIAKAQNKSLEAEQSDTIFEPSAPSIDNSKLINFYSELENRKRIFSDSNRIIQTTNDFAVFQKRMEDLHNHIEWSYQMLNEGMPAQVNMSYEESMEDFGKCYNENAYRIAKYIASSGDTPQKAKNRIPKLNEILSSLKDAKNKESYNTLIKSRIRILELKSNEG